MVFKLNHLLLFPSITFVLGQNVSVISVEQAFNTSQIVPDVISTFTPAAILDVVFPNNISVTPGMNLTMAQTLNEPQFFLTFNSTGDIATTDTFVVALVDPDAPTPQNTSMSQFRHFLGGGFQLNSTGTNTTDVLLVNSTAALTDYVNPTPPVGSDPHRYTILVFVQPANFTTAAPVLVNSSTPRNNFNLTIFAEAVGLGNPIAGSFFLTGPDNSTNTTTSASGSASGSVSATASGATNTSPVTTGAALRLNGSILLDMLLAGLFVILPAII